MSIMMYGRGEIIDNMLNSMFTNIMPTYDIYGGEFHDSIIINKENVYGLCNQEHTNVQQIPCVHGVVRDLLDSRCVIEITDNSHRELICYRVGELQKRFNSYNKSSCYKLFLDNKSIKDYLYGLSYSVGCTEIHYSTTLEFYELVWDITYSYNMGLSRLTNIIDKPFDVSKKDKKSRSNGRARWRGKVKW